MTGMDSFYAVVREQEPRLYEQICAFASTFGQPEDDIDIKTRYQVERFCMGLVAKQVQP